MGILNMKLIFNKFDHAFNFSLLRAVEAAATKVDPVVLAVSCPASTPTRIRRTLSTT
jgi:hypothetical protein